MTPPRSKSLLAMLICAALTRGAAGQPTTAPADDALAARAAVQRAALARVAPYIVRIDTIGGAQPVAESGGGPAFRQADGPTTGLIWSAGGEIITSNFNFVRDPSVILVTFADGRQLVARLVARDRVARLALLKVEATDLPAPPTRAPAELRVGQTLLVAGRGHGAPQPTVSAGVLSGVQRMAGLALQIDAKTSPANYGGPVFGLTGDVIGVCVPMGPGEDELAGVEWYDSGIGFAIDAELVGQRVARLRAGHDLRRGYLGLQLDMTPPLAAMHRPMSAPATQPTSQPASQPASQPIGPPGVRVLGVTGPAAAAGLQEGDVLVALGDTPTPTALVFARTAARLVAGDSVTVHYWRAGQTAQAAVRLATQEDVAASQPATSRPATSQPAP
jgi:serine protease Do